MRDQLEETNKSICDHKFDLRPIYCILKYESGNWCLYKYIPTYLTIK